VQIYFLQISQ